MVCGLIRGQDFHDGLSDEFASGYVREILVSLVETKKASLPVLVKDRYRHAVNEGAKEVLLPPYLFFGPSPRRYVVEDHKL